MAEDPRLDLVSSAGGSQEARQTGQMADLTRRLDALEHGSAAQAGYATVDLGVPIAIRVPASGLVVFFAVANLNTGTGVNALVQLTEDGANLGNIIGGQPGSTLDFASVPGSNTGVSLPTSRGGPSALSGRAPGLHTYSLTGSASSGSVTIAARSLWVWTLV
jgi:hypothetical protein